MSKGKDPTIQRAANDVPRRTLRMSFKFDQNPALFLNTDTIFMRPAQSELPPFAGFLKFRPFFLPSRAFQQNKFVPRGTFRQPAEQLAHLTYRSNHDSSNFTLSKQSFRATGVYLNAFESERGDRALQKCRLMSFRV
jgi:hypothetical protein